LLHRPDPLWEGEEIAEAFQKLRLSGKVRYFGVSNQNRFQMEYLQSFLTEPLVANQVEMSLLHHGFVELGISFNQNSPRYPDGWEGTMEYCRTKPVLLQAWSTLAQGALTGNLDGNPKTSERRPRWCKNMPGVTKPPRKPSCWRGCSNTRRRSSPCWERRAPIDCGHVSNLFPFL